MPVILATFIFLFQKKKKKKICWDVFQLAFESWASLSRELEWLMQAASSLS